MQMFKVWNVLRTVKKSVAADTLETLKAKGKKKLGLNEDEVCLVFDEKDGTEIDDDDCLFSYEKGSVFLLGENWVSRDEAMEMRRWPAHDTSCNVAGGKKSDLVDCSKKESWDTEAESEHDFSTDDMVSFKGVEMKLDDERFEKPKDNVVSFNGVEMKLDDEKSESLKEDGVSFNGVEMKLDDERFESPEEKVVSYKCLELESADEKWPEPDKPLSVKSVESDHDGSVATGNNETSRRLQEKAAVQKRKATDDSSEKVETDLMDQRPSKQRKLVTTVLIDENKCRHAKMKQLKIFTEKDITKSKCDLEKKRKIFWNEKAEQLCTNVKTANLSKITLTGIIDVAWTLRKTSIIEEEARRIANEEIIFTRGESKDRIQKKETIPRNLDRLESAHAVVSDMNEKMERFRDLSKNAKSKKEINEYNKEYSRLKILMDGAYSELKKAQDATAKAIKVKKQLLDNYIKSKRKEDLNNQ